nr:unnamed protein product [Callosobruchus analis]
MAHKQKKENSLPAGKSLSHDELLLNGSIDEQPTEQQQQPINNNPQPGTSGIRTKKLKSLGETKKRKYHNDSEDEETEDDSEPIFHDSSDDDNDWDTYRAKNKATVQEEEIPFLASIKPLMKQIDTFVVVQCEGNHYPGIIEHVEEDGAYVRAMIKSFKDWKWPMRKDVLFYGWDKIVGSINPPKILKETYFQ